ncbi:MAG: hypothetical protein FJZ01_03355 [Candidatus Sericytochromatia bacterium]|nr:hypothetical protein [Candidatus Tanganyikabacteria bacterium]
MDWPFWRELLHWRRDRPARLAAEGEAQALRLELAEVRAALTQLQGDLERQRAGECGRRVVAVQAAVEPLLADLAGPVALLATQAHLLQAGVGALEPGDVMAVVRRLVRVLGDHGIELVGGSGEAARFDPGRHEPVGEGAVPAPGQKVVIRIPGLRMGEHVLRKAGVEAGIVSAAGER